jgi:hypothetical protein
MVKFFSSIIILYLVSSLNGKADDSAFPFFDFMHGEDADYWESHEDIKAKAQPTANPRGNVNKYPLSSLILQESHSVNVGNETEKYYYLAYATPSNGNIASLFGHLFLIVTDKPQSPPVDGVSIQYIAQTDNATGFNLVTKGTRRHFLGKIEKSNFVELSEEYLENQHRNIIYFEVKATKLGQYLFNLFLDEISNSIGKYSFQKNNCALFAHYAINLLVAKKTSEIDLSLPSIYSPQAVLKRAYSKNYLHFSSIEKSTLNFLTNSRFDSIRLRQLKRNPTAIKEYIDQGFISNEYAQKYLKYQLKSGAISMHEFTSLLEITGKKSISKSDFKLNLGLRPKSSFKIKSGIFNGALFAETVLNPFSIQSNNEISLYPNWKTIKFLSTSLFFHSHKKELKFFINEFDLINLDYNSGAAFLNDRLGFHFKAGHKDSILTSDKAHAVRSYTSASVKKSYNLNRNSDLEFEMGFDANFYRNVSDINVIAPFLSSIISVKHANSRKTDIRISYTSLSRNKLEVIQIDSRFHFTKRLKKPFVEGAIFFTKNDVIASLSLGASF